MNRHELRALIEDGESVTVEFKRKFTSSEKIAKEITAFANTKGGYLFIGIDDDKSIVGVQSEKEVIALVEVACAFYISPPVEPTIEIVHVEYKDVIVVHVPESEIKPHRIICKDPKEKEHDGRAYIRQADRSVAASKEMEKVLKFQNADRPALKLSIGHREKSLFTYLETNNRATVKQFAKLVNISERWASRLMVRLVQAGVLQIHTEQGSDYYTLTG